MSKELKVFQMNDYDWCATDGFAEDINDWYNKNYTENNIEDVRLCNLDKEGAWCLTEGVKDIERLGDSDEIISIEIINGQSRRKVQVGDLMRRYDEVYKFTSFREMLSKEGEYTEPYVISTTEW